MDRATVSPHDRFDVGAAVDTGPFGARQWAAFFLAAMIVVLDGFDNQLLALSVSQIVEEFGSDRSVFSWIFAVGYLGMAVGTALGGWLGDRIGRRPTAIMATVLVGGTTLATSVAPDVLTIGVLRAVSGVGVGMIFPVVAALVAESSPLRRRSLTVALALAGVPIGGILGGLVAAEILPGSGWRTLFLVGGILPLAFAAMLMFALRESMLFLVDRGRPADITEVRGRLARLGHDVPADARLTVQENESVARASVRALLDKYFRRDTFALWGLFFVSLLGVYSFFSWGPSLFVDAGFDVVFASRTISLYNAGGIAMSVLGAWAMIRFGSRPTLSLLAVGMVVTASWLYLDQPEPGGNTSIVVVQLIVHGAAFAGMQGVLYALAAYVYPSNIRSTGVGASGSVGRLGAILASFLGAALLSVGGGAFFVMLAVCGVLAAIALNVVRRHAPPIRRARGGVPVRERNSA